MDRRKKHSRLNAAVYAGLLLVLCVQIGCQDPVDECVGPNPDPAKCSPERVYANLIRHVDSVPNVRSVTVWERPDVIQDRSGPSLKIETAHYLIYTTLGDPLILRQIPMLMESAFRSYSQTVGQSANVDVKLPIYLFDTRGQWEDFTRHWTGVHADVYLSIKSGAYYLNGATVAYHINRRANFSVLAHEGWHQYAHRLVRCRLPAWLDEGLATNFESYQWEKGSVKFVPARNGNRLLSLQKTLGNGHFLTITQLLRLEPGGLLETGARLHGGAADRQVPGYYAQVYALTRFLREHDYGRHYLRFRNLLEDARDCQWPLEGALLEEAVRRDRNATRRWNAYVGPFVFEHYVTANVDQLEHAYRAYCYRIASTVRSQ